ncbi:MAG: hypothetical protein H6718_29245 [Polyangiaceae bacterium]|nr:hypothetical protein [Myxococcales bacterium]MCB9589536.1 hypothetical protein [Polyangiaceae bacterium]MCB9609164.1 hypothetical protein [Polyangiaceae bacterium]
MLAMRHVTLGLLGLAALSAASSCATDPPNRGCQRLVDFSCGCFPECREQDTKVINDQDRDACEQRLEEHFQSWRHCEFDCRGDCQYGWGTCAFELYRSVGLDPQGICDGRDAGADAASDASSDAATDAMEAGNGG